MINFLKHLNWRSIGAAFCSFISILSVAPYTLGEVANWIPPKIKAPIFIASAIATVLLRFLNSLPKKKT